MRTSDASGRTGLLVSHQLPVERSDPPTAHAYSFPRRDSWRVSLASHRKSWLVDGQLGLHIRDVNIRLAQMKSASTRPACTTKHNSRVERLSQRVAGLSLGESFQNVIHFAREKAEEALFLEEMVKSTDTASIDTPNNSSNTRLSGTSKAKRLTDATVLLALHREARTGAPAPVRQGKPRTKAKVPIVVVCVSWSSSPPHFLQKKAELKRFMEKELVPWIWADLQASGRSNCELAQAVAKVVKEDLAVATAVGVIGLNSLVSVSVERPPIEQRVAHR